MAWELAGGAGGERPVPPADADADAGGLRHTLPQPHGGPSRVPLPQYASGEDPVLRELHAGGFTALASSLEGLRPQKVGCGSILALRVTPTSTNPMPWQPCLS